MYKLPHFQNKSCSLHAVVMISPVKNRCVLLRHIFSLTLRRTGMERFETLKPMSKIPYVHRCVSVWIQQAYVLELVLDRLLYNCFSGFRPNKGYWSNKDDFAQCITHTIKCFYYIPKNKAEKYFWGKELDVLLGLSLWTDSHSNCIVFLLISCWGHVFLIYINLPNEKPVSWKTMAKRLISFLW